MSAVFGESSRPGSAPPSTRIRIAPTACTHFEGPISGFRAIRHKLVDMAVDYGDVKLCAIGEGSSGIQCLAIARQLPGNG
jgi:alkylation response protein AidB-like acyl-CoA dehydrogenase